MNIVSGARLSSNGLHLGHYLGCIQPLIYNRLEFDDINYFFIINDKLYPQRNADLKEFFLDLYSIKRTYNIRNFHVILDSDLLPNYYKFLRYLNTHVTYTNLASVYPTKNKNRDNIMVSDFLFPIEQSASYYLLKAEYVFLNNDNLRFVTFARELAKRINRLNPHISLVIPQLISGVIPRLDGYNYKKHCKSNGNAIFLSDPIDIIKEKIYKLFNMKYLFRAIPEEQQKFEKEYPYFLPETYLPFQYLKAFEKNFDINNISNNLRISTNRCDLIDYLTNTILKIILPIQEAREQLKKEYDKILNHYENDVIKSIYVANNTIGCLDKLII